MSNNLFRVHRLNPTGMRKAQRLAGAFTDLLGVVEEFGASGDARALAVVRTKLEEACFFAKKAMACDPVNQEPPHGVANHVGPGDT